LDDTNLKESAYLARGVGPSRITKSSGVLFRTPRAAISATWLHKTQAGVVSQIRPKQGHLQLAEKAYEALREQILRRLKSTTKDSAANQEKALSRN